MKPLLRSGRFWTWSVPLLLYALFWLWYTPLAGPMTRGEIDAAVADLQARGAPGERVALFRAFFEADDGRSFIMVNLIDLASEPPTLAATGEGASSAELMDHYMEFMWPALLSRASHPVFLGEALAPVVDVVGIEGAEQWETAALMRYRSRRDMWTIASNPRFSERHDYKIAALEKTIAFPVTPQFWLGDLRLVLLLAMATGLGLVDALVFRRPRLAPAQGRTG